MILFRYLLLALLVPVVVPAQILPPQVGLAGGIGCQGFPCVNTGTLIMATDADHYMTVQETSAFNLKITSSVSLTATRKLIAPSGRFPFTIENATTGSQSITIIGPSGAGVTIPNGQTLSVWNNGTDYVPIGAVTSVTTTGTTGPATLTGSILNIPQYSFSSGLSGMTTGQIPVAASSSTVTSSIPTTGTGNIVLSASPALSGTPTAPTAALGDNSTQLATTAFVSGQFPVVYNCTYSTTTINAGSSTNCVGTGSGRLQSVVIATWQGDPTTLTTVAPLIISTYMTSAGTPSVSLYNPTAAPITITAVLNMQVIYQ